MIKVLFVCLGNICRSPMAEALFQKLVDDAGLADQIQVDSAGLGSWHIGEPAHVGTQHILQQQGIGYSGRSRPVTPGDMQEPQTYIIGMDNSNLNTLRQRYGQHPRLFRLLDFATETAETEVPDPYYSDNFDYVYQLVADGCQGLMATIRQNEAV